MTLSQLVTAVVVLAMVTALIVAGFRRAKHIGRDRALHFQRLAEAVERRLRDGADD